MVATRDEYFSDFHVLGSNMWVIAGPVAHVLLWYILLSFYYPKSEIRINVRVSKVIMKTHLPGEILGLQLHGLILPSIQNSPTIWMSSDQIDSIQSDWGLCLDCCRERSSEYVVLSLNSIDSCNRFMVDLHSAILYLLTTPLPALF